MKKLVLKKENIISLSNQEMNSVVGGGEKRSDRLNGQCNYSYQHPAGYYSDTDGNGCDEFHLTNCQTAA